MPGPLPKRNRHRRNMPALGDWQVLPDDPYKGPKPRKPSGLHAHASSVWEAAWSDPAAHMWSESDHLMVVELAQLCERMDRDEDVPGWVSTRALEIRRLLGLTKIGRQKYRWLLPSEAAQWIDEPESDEDAADFAEKQWGHLRAVSE